MIRFRGLVKNFGTERVLAGLDATIAAGRVTGLVGPNGTGKTTLLKILLGLTHADKGSVVVGGRLLDGSAEYRGQIGYMPQIARFPAHLSGRDLLGMLMALRSPGEKPDLSLVDAFGLDAEFDRPLGVLSGGTRQKVNAVLALAFRPTLLVLDEPTAGLDPSACEVVKQRIHTERARGTTVIITSHVLPELEELADDVLFLSGGAAMFSGAVADLRRQTGEATLERAVAHILAGRLALAAA